MKLSLLVFFVFITVRLLPAQDQQNVDYYLNDDNISSSKNIIKVDGIALIHGELPISWERVLTRRLSAEAGVGLLLPYYVPDFLSLLVEPAENFSNDKFGTSYWLKAKVYQDEAPELHFMEFTFHRRNFADTRVTDLSFGLGNQLFINKRVAFEYIIGVGMRFQQVSNEQYLFDRDSDATIIVPLQIKFGYLF